MTDWTLYRPATTAEALTLEVYAADQHSPDEVYLDEDTTVRAVKSQDTNRWYVPLAECHCGDVVEYDGSWDDRSHRRCHLIP